MLRLIMVGTCYVDTILSVDHYPEEDEKLRASSLIRRRGGNCPNSLEVIQQLVDSDHSRSSFDLISVFPGCESASTKFIRKTLGPMINCDCCIYREDLIEPASAYIFQSRTTGSRTIVNHNELPEMTVNEFKSSVESLEPLNNACFHFEGRMPEITLQCILYIRQQYPSALISVEVEKPNRPGLDKLATEADFIFYAKGWAQAYGYSSMEECLISQTNVTPKAKYMCCTWGEKGAAMLTKQSDACISVPALEIPPTDIVDSIGAGDTFIAGMLFGFLCHHDDWDHKSKLQFGTKLAGLKVRQYGFQGLGDALARHLNPEKFPS